MKKLLRKKFMDARDNLSCKQITVRSRKIIANALRLNEIKKAKVVHCYVSKKTEVFTHDLLNRLYNSGKICLIPSIKNNRIVSCIFKNFKNLKKGRYDILESKVKKDFPKNKIDVILVPGLAFDLRGYRIGYGLGYYDIFLKDTRSFKVGLAYDFQINNKIPNNIHDIPVDCIITEKRLIICKDDPQIKSI